MSDFDADPTDLGALLAALLAYWQRRPGAMDTLEGIQRWWLPAGASRSEVARALAVLVERGTVVAQAAADGRVRYRLSAQRAGDADPAGGATGT